MRLPDGPSKMVVFLMRPQVEFGPYDRRQDASQLTNTQFNSWWLTLPAKRSSAKFSTMNDRLWNFFGLKFSNRITKWLDPLLTMFFSYNLYFEPKFLAQMNSESKTRFFLFFLNIKMDQKKSTPKIIWVRQSWNSEIILFRPIIQISICGMKNLNYILSLIGGSDTSQWLEITRLTFLPKYSKSQWAFLRNRWFQKLKK